MRQRFKGHLRFSMVLIPVKVYNGEETQDKVKLNQFHVGCGGAVGKKDYCKACNETLTSDLIYKGYKIDDEHVVQISDEDVDNIKLESTKVIDISGFVDKSEIPVTFYEKPLFIGPDGKVGESTYDVFVQTLKISGKCAIGKIVLSHGREDQVVISAIDNALVMCVIRYKDEVRQVSEIPNLQNCKPAQKEMIDLAVDLCNSMTHKFEDLSVTNEYNAKLKELIDVKAQGKLEVPKTGKSEQPASVDIMSMLKASQALIKPNDDASGKLTITKIESKTKVKSTKKKVAV